MTGVTKRRTATTLRYWYILAAGPVLWIVHLSGASALVPYACAHDARWTVDALTAATAIPTAAALALAVRMWRARPDSDTAGAGTAGNAGLFVVSGMLFSAISLLLILLEGFPNLVLEPCR